MKKLSAYMIVITAMLLVMSVTFLQSQMRDAKIARSEEPKVIEVVSNNVQDEEEEQNAVETEQTPTQEDEDEKELDNESEQEEEFESEKAPAIMDEYYASSPFDFIPAEENPMYNTDSGEIHDSAGIRKTPEYDEIPVDVYNTNYDTESVDFYKLDFGVADNDNVSPSTCMEIIEKNDSLSILVNNCNLKPWYTKSVDTGDDGEAYYLFFRNCDASVYMYREYDSEEYEVSDIMPASKIHEGWDEINWDKPLIIYKYLSKYDRDVMRDIESQLKFEDFGYDVWWTNYQLGDSQAVFFRTLDTEFKDPIKIEVSAWR